MTLEEQIRSNRVRSGMLVLSFGLVFVGIGAAVQAVYGGASLILIAGIAFVYAIFAWFANGKMVASWTGAKSVTKEQYPELVRAVENASIGAGLTVTPPGWCCGGRCGSSTIPARTPSPRAARRRAPTSPRPPGCSG